MSVYLGTQKIAGNQRVTGGGGGGGTWGSITGTLSNQIDLQNALNNKVDKDGAKVLSTNDYTTAEKNKLSGIEAEANKYVLPTASSSELGGIKVGTGLTAVDGVLSADVTKPDLDGKVDKVDGKQLSTNDFDNAYKTKLDGIEAEANKYVLTNATTTNLGGIKVGTGLTAVDGVLNADVSKVELDSKVTQEVGKGLSSNDYTTDEKTKVAGAEQSSNKSTVISSASTDTEYSSSKSVYDFVNATLTGVYKPKGSVLFESLPALSSDKIGNVYNVTNAFVTTSDFKCGAGVSYPANTNVAIIELSAGVYKYDAMSGIVDLSNYVQKETGKGLSTNDYTTAEKTKLSTAEQTTNKVTSISSASTDTQYPSAKAVYTISETKVDKDGNKKLSTEDYTTAEKTKLAGLENYTLPTASATVKGGIKVGNNLSITSDGTLSGDVSTTDLSNKANHSNKNLCGRDNKIFYPVDLKVGDTITMSTKGNVTIKEDDGSPLLCFYDENKQLLSKKSFIVGTSYRTLVLPSDTYGTKYISWENPYPVEMQVEKSSKTDYEPYNNGIVDVLEQSIDFKQNSEIDIPKAGANIKGLSRLFVGGLKGVCRYLVVPEKYKVSTRDIIYFPCDVICIISDGFQCGYIKCSDKYGSEHDWSGWKSSGSIVLEKGYYMFQIRKQNFDASETADIDIWSSKINFYKIETKYDYKTIGTYINTKVNRYNVSELPYKLPTPAEVGLGAAAIQGMTYCNGVIFQLYSDNVICLIDFSTGEVINKFNINSDHGDTIDFTNTYYDSADEFPLCHITSDSNPAKLYVVRITRNGANLIKTLTFPLDKTGYYAGHITDNLNGVIYQLGYKNNDFLTSANGNKTILSAWDINNLTQNGDGTFTPAFISKTEIPFIFVMQGQCMFDGKLVVVSSASHNYGIDTRILFINPDSGRIENIMSDLPSDLRYQEVEGIAFVDVGGEYCAIFTNQSAQVIKMEFEN